MPGSPNRLTQFWQELKRRKVIKVIAMYAATAFIIILSWIFDVTPEGVKKTEPVQLVKKKETTPDPVKRGLKISDGVIALLVVVVCILIYPKIFRKDKFEEIHFTISGRVAFKIFLSLRYQIQRSYQSDSIRPCMLYLRVKEF